MSVVHELDTLTPSEKAYLEGLYARWLSARDVKAWAEADALRAELVSAGVDLEEWSWCTIFESSASRYSRFKERQASA